jgi:hypothetical protein
MNIANSRATMIINICALFLACITAAETMFIDIEVFGKVHYGAVWPTVLPALVMFAINRKTFSCVFILLYLALSLDLAYQYWRPPDYSRNILGWQTLFFIISLVFLFLHLAGFVTTMIKGLVTSKTDK